MTNQQFFTSAWSWNPWVIIICAAGLLIFGRGPALGEKFPVWPRQKTGWLIAGILLFFLTLASPLDTLADGYLFSAHMLQHLLLLLVIPPLILLSLPANAVPRRLETAPGKWAVSLARQPFATWILGVGGMWLWHAPLLCDAAVANPWVHRLQYGSLLLMGAAFWWPIIGPWQRQRLAPLAGMVYLFTACLGCTILGIIITFSPIEVCSIYLHPADRLGILSLIQNQWGLTPAKDQQLGGLLMWVPACLIYFFGILGLLARYYRETGHAATVPEPQTASLLLNKTHGR